MQYLKYSCLLLLIIIHFQSSSKENDLLSQKITEQFDNLSLKEVFSILKNKYQLKIAYSDRLIREERVDISLDNEPIGAAFKAILEGKSLHYEIIPPSAIIITKTKRKYNHNLVGLVLDAASGEPLPYTQLQILNINKTVATNKDGIFSIIAYDNDTLKLKTHYIGYEDSTVQILSENYDKRIIIELVNNNTLTEVIVEDNQSEDFEVLDQINGTIVNASFAESIPQAAEADALRAIQLLPGVNATNELSSRMFINGGTASQNLVTFDGFTIYHVDHFFGYFSAINPLAIKSIRVMKGGFDAKYGGRSSSIVEFTGKKGNNQKIAGSLSLNALSFNSSLEIPLTNKTTLFFSGRKSYTDVIQTSLFEKIINLYENNITDNSSFQVDISNQSFTPQFNYSDMNIKLSTKVGLKNRMSLSFYDSNDLLNYEELYDADFKDDDYISSVGKNGLVNWGNVGGSAKWSTLWNANHYSNLLLSYSNYNSQFNETSTFTIDDDRETVIQKEKNQIKEMSFKIDHEWNLNNHVIEAGVKASQYGTNIDNQIDDSIYVHKEQSDAYLLTNYFQVHFGFKPKAKFTLGLRNNYLTTTGLWYIDPRMSISYPVGDNIMLNASTGMYSQFVNQINTENALEGSRDLWFISDDEIPVQHATHTMLGLTYSKNDVSISTSGFLKQFDGIMDYAYRFGKDMSEFENYENLFFTGEGNAKGLEFLFKKSNQKFTHWIGYTLSEVEYNFQDLNNGNPFYADHDQTHEFNIFTSYKRGNFEFYTTWLYGSGKPYSSIDEKNINSKNEEKVIVFRNFEKNAERLPDYHRLDFGVNYFADMGNYKLKITANIFNLYNRTNVYDRNYEVFKNKGLNRKNGAKNYVKSYDVKLMGITPNLSVKLSF